MTKKLVVVLAIAMLLVPAALFGQQVKGDKELGLSATMMFQSGGGVTTGNGNMFASLGYYATRQVEVKAGFGMGFNSTVANGATEWSSTPEFYGGFAYNFAAEGRKAFPYVAAEFLTMGQVGGGSSSWTNFIRPNGGVKYFFKRNVAFDMNFGYDRMLQSGSGTTIDARMGLLFVF